ncbi:MAG: spore coat biosynthesis protein F [Nitrospira sp.]|nr:spore coat biosynthesis protein F [Nitrospira sp.]
MRVVASVECRMSSRRLPGKHVKSLLGRPMLYRLLERLRRGRCADVICLATSTDQSDETLVRVAEEAGVAAYRGPLEDVLSRVIGAAREVEADVIAEITGDCPLIDPGIVDAVVDRYLKGGYDYVTNVLDELTFPVGFDVQVFSLTLLEEVSRLTSDPQDRENVTSFIYRNPQRYRLLNVRAPRALDRPRYRLCVDYPQDFDLIEQIYRALYPRDPAFTARAIVELLDSRPDLANANNSMPNAFEWPSSGGKADQEVLALA